MSDACSAIKCEKNRSLKSIHMLVKSGGQANFIYCCNFRYKHSVIQAPTFDGALDTLTDYKLFLHHTPVLYNQMTSHFLLLESLPAYSFP